MAKMTYSEQLRHPNWQRKRLEKLEAARWECESCGDKETTLNVHHKRYIKGRMAWDYDASLLAVLCEPCHKSEHADRELLGRVIEMEGPDVVLGLAAGYATSNRSADPETLELAREGRELYFEIGVVASICERRGMEFWRSIIRTYAESKPPEHPIAIYAQRMDESKK